MTPDYSAWNFVLLLGITAAVLVIGGLSVYLEWNKSRDTSRILTVAQGWDQLFKLNSAKADRTLDSIKQESVGAVAEIRHLVAAAPPGAAGPAGPAGAAGDAGAAGVPGRDGRDGLLIRDVPTAAAAAGQAALEAAADGTDEHEPLGG